VLGPLAEVAPDELHPVLERSYSALWAEFDPAAQPLRRVEFDWDAA
jgi:2-amino-4-hydroxy-6-hydroxymethyldihydropteridine diphosphokinase